MRLAPAFWVCWLAAVALVAGCSAWKAVPDARRALRAGSPHRAQDADTGRTAQVSARLHGSRAHVTHLRDSDIRSTADRSNSSGYSSIASEIEREMARTRAEWEARRRELAAVQPAPADLPDAEQRTSDAGSKDILVTDRMLAVEREYAPRYLNYRIRIGTLEARVAEASGSVRDSLLKKLDQAKADLAALDELYSRDIEIARHDSSPVVGKDEGAAPSKRNVDMDSRPEGKAGGGAD